MENRLKAGRREGQMSQEAPAINQGKHNKGLDDHAEKGVDAYSPVMAGEGGFAEGLEVGKRERRTLGFGLRSWKHPHKQMRTTGGTGPERAGIPF